MNRYADTAGRGFASILTKSGLLAMAVAVNMNGASAADTDVVTKNPNSYQYWQSSDSQMMEEYIDAPIPPGFKVLNTELDGPVFTDANGRTLYSWPLRNLRNGTTGDRKDGGKSMCTDEVLKVTSGLMSPYQIGRAHV